MTTWSRNVAILSSLTCVLVACKERLSSRAGDALLPVLADDTLPKVVMSESIALADSSWRVWMLDPGFYKVELMVDASNSGGNGLELVWDPPTCLPRREAQQIEAECATPGGNGNLRIINPPSGRLASTVHASVKLTRVPPP
jgi:hypothetical protein